MVVLVMLEETPGHSPVLAQVNSVPSPLSNERPSRDVVTLYGVPSAESLALALAAGTRGDRGRRVERSLHGAARHARSGDPARGAPGNVWSALERVRAGDPAVGRRTADARLA